MTPEMKKTTVYLLISVSDELPELTVNNGAASITVPIIINKETYDVADGAKFWGDEEFVSYPSTPMSAYYTKDGWCWEFGELLKSSEVEQLTHWLKPSEGYFFTPEDLLSLRRKWADEAWVAGWQALFSQQNYSPNTPDRKTYLNNLTIE